MNGASCRWRSLSIEATRSLALRSLLDHIGLAALWTKLVVPFFVTNA
jgi:hypothetical protein